jgi:preprotein translocase subunit Sss1
MDNKLLVRILCIVLAGVMVLGLVGMVIPMLVG